MTNSQTILHNLKMILLTAIPTILGIILALKGTITLPEWVTTIVAILTLIEHVLNGNTPTQSIPATLENPVQ